MPFRKIIFWLHLIAGLIAGAVIAVMSVTGIGIAFEEEILKWFDRKVSRIEVRPASGEKLPLMELKQRVESARPGFRVTSVVIHRDPTLAWEFHADGDGPLYVDPYSGATNDTRSHGAHEVIHKLEEWHRWLGDKDGQASVGRLVTGVSNLMFVVVCVSGLYLWFPRSWGRRALRPLVGLKFGYKGKARDFNLHNVFGFWSLPVLLVLGGTAVAISFEWGHRLVFTVAGEEAPKSRNYGMMFVPPPVVPVPSEGAARLPLDEAFARVATAFPDWKSISLEQFPAVSGPAIEPLDFGVTLPDHMPSRAYIPVKSDPFTGGILQAVRFQDRSPGLQARVWMRFLHTGGAFGLPGKIIASLACAASLVLVWTGFALSWRRFFGKRRRSVPSASSPDFPSP
ncbi:PepSY domain-containing protein [Luteolibacter yonseiensis]|uniref:PepSY domain-containing protein n=1 Tax=Luteolibacter yonseiensis TaxID=1144680 RepID=A0A934R1U1_9BACT|nr:PepSY-associated TM helix domain-containing protein [Luteolibacter yonseiensis]MBK1815249.1 PepSY domain-containing protein [Luteolibacter yonseiensis]